MRAQDELSGLSKHRVVVQLDHAAGALLRRIDDVGVKRARVNVQAHSAVAELFRIDHAMDGIGRIDRAGVSGIHFNSIRRRELTSSVIDVLRYKMKIFDH